MRFPSSKRGSKPDCEFKMRILSEEEWLSLKAEHQDFVSPWIEAYRKRRALGQSHPVHDFLFAYYQTNRQVFLKWRPMADMKLGGSKAKEFLQDDRYCEFEEGVGLNIEAISPKDRDRIQWVENLLRQSIDRPPRFNCFGLHEWAMVYKTKAIRHEKTPLRFNPSEIARVVESLPICCTHYDAYRFFTDAAKPYNTANPGRENRADNEQFGCVHFNMDLYRWSYKLSPWIGSEFIDKAFKLAIEARSLDMRASPYDVSEYGYEPIPIESSEGREQYVKEQVDLFQRGRRLAETLQKECQFLLVSALEEMETC